MTQRQNETKQNTNRPKTQNNQTKQTAKRNQRPKARQFPINSLTLIFD